MKWDAVVSAAALIAVATATANAGEAAKPTAPAPSTNAAAVAPSNSDANAQQGGSSHVEASDQSGHVGHAGRDQTKAYRFGGGNRF